MNSLTKIAVGYLLFVGFFFYQLPPIGVNGKMLISAHSYLPSMSVLHFYLQILCIYIGGG